MSELILTGKVCPYCGAPSEYIDSSQVYASGQSYGMVYACLPCNAWVGVHEGTSVAKGRLANMELRQAKQEAHWYFDAIWKEKIRREDCTKRKAREAGYQWLAQQMGMTRQECHIGMFDVEQCQRVVELCKPYLTKIATSK